MADKAPKLPVHIKNIIRGSKHPVSKAAEMRLSLSRSQLTSLAFHIPNFSGRELGVLPSRFPTSFSMLLSAPRFSPIECGREIAWNLGVLMRDAPKLKAFLTQRKLFDEAVLAGQWESAASALSEIEGAFGVSIWLIESQIALLQLSKGMESQKMFTKKCRDQSPENLAGPIAFFISQRNEGTINPFRYKRQIADNLQAWHSPEDLADYLRFRLSDEYPSSPKQIANILRYEATASAIDLYETFVKLAMQAVAVDCCAGLPEFATALKILNNAIADSRIQRSVFVLEPHRNPPFEYIAHNLEPFNFFAQGSEEECAQSASEQLCTPYGNPSLAILMAHAKADSPFIPSAEARSQGVRTRFAELACRLVSKAPDFEEAYYELLRLSLNLRSSQFSAILKSLAVSEASSRPSFGGPHELATFLNSSFMDVFGVRHLPPTARKLYIERLIAEYGSQPSVLIAADRAGIPELSRRYPDAPPYSEHIYREILVEDALSSEDWDVAIRVADTIAAGASLRRRRRALRYKAHALLSANRLEDLVHCIAENCVSDPGLVAMMPVQECVSRLDRPARKRLSKFLSLPIVLDLCSRHYTDDFDNFRSYAYEDFLRSHDMTRPSELKGRETEFNTPMLIYYLRHLCIPEVMRISRAFKSTRALEDERLAVCALLIEIDEHSTDDYEQESRRITWDQVIRSGVGEVERSKIFIDSSAIRRWADKELKESFTRYQALLRTGMDAGGEGFNEAIKEALKHLLTGAPLSTEILTLPKNEASDLLVTLVSRFLGECLSSPKHGLDCYLSMQIRHGVLSGQLRQPLEEERIITQRDSDTLEYKKNEFWMQRLSHVHPATTDRIDVALRTFSSQYDDLINLIKDELIQIRSKDRPQGLFSMSINQLVFRELASAITTETTFEEFSNACFRVFWDSLEPSLTDVRNSIDQTLKPQMNQLFIELESKLGSFDGDANLPELNSAIRFAQTKAQGALDRVKDWFRVPKAKGKQAYKFDELVHIGLQYVKNMHRSFEPVLRTEISQMGEFEQLLVFSNIFFIIFHNISRHSGLRRPTIDLNAKLDGSVLHVSVRSSVASSSAHAESLAKVQRIRQAIAEGGYLGAVRSEGGTGLIKLHNIIRADAYPSNKLEFGFSQDGLFEVKLQIGTYELV